MPENQFKKKYSKAVAIEKIKHFCAYQERCHKEVKDKLYNWGLFSSEVEAIIAEIISENYLNEQRFAESFVSGKFRIKHWGRIKIESELKFRNVSPYCIKKGLLEIDEDEYLATCKKLAETKSSRLKQNLNDWERKGKISRFLLSKGYEYSIINQILEEI